jgi:hypothetical protein
MSGNSEPVRPLPIRPIETTQELLAKCKKHHADIKAAMKEDRPFLPPASIHGPLLAEDCASGFFLLPNLRQLWAAALALDPANPPPPPGEPANPEDAVKALDELIQWCRSKLPKEPSEEAIICYRLFLARDGKQSTLAEWMSHELNKTIKQYQVSRWLKQVRVWLKAGNVLPDLTAENKGCPRQRTRPMDSRMIDQGVGQEKSIRRQSRAADQDAELKKLIAEQQAEDDYL